MESPQNTLIVAPTGDEGGGRQIENQTAIHLGIEGDVEVIEVFVRIAKLGLLAPTFQQAIAATGKFVGDQAGIRSMGAMDSTLAWCRRSRESDRTVMGEHIAVEGIERGVVEVWDQHTFAQIIQH